jgi:MFS family permease
VLAILAVLGMFGITDLRDVKPAEQGELSKAKPATDGSKQSLLAPAAAAPPRPRADLGRVLAAVALWRDDPLVLLLNPIQMTFGFCAGMLAANITNKVVKLKFGDSEWVVYGAMLTSLPALVAGILQYPFKLVANRFDKLPLMLLGLSGFVALSCIVYTLTEEQLIEWAILVPLYLLQGLGRACYEGTNRALYADFFPNNSAAAFSNIVMANGVSSALLFFVKSALPKTDNKTLPLLTLCSAVPTVFFYLIAELIHRRRRRQAEIEKVV